MAAYDAFVSISGEAELYDNIPSLVSIDSVMIDTMTNDNSASMTKYSGTEIFFDGCSLNIVNNILPTAEIGDLCEDDIIVNICENVCPIRAESNETVLISNLGMYKITDKLAFLAEISNSKGEALPRLILLLEGYTNQVVLRSDRNGVVCEYIPFDDYYDFIGISPNYIVYRFQQKIETGFFVYNLVMNKATKANATYRQLHRKFV